MIEWPGAPRTIERAIDVWSLLPGSLEDLIERWGWSEIASLSTPVAARFWTLVVHADRDLRLRSRWLDATVDRAASGELDRRRHLGLPPLGRDVVAGIDHRALGQRLFAAAYG